MKPARGPGKASGELGLFRGSPTRSQPRDNRGRFVAVHYSRERLKVLAVARDMRRRLGLPPASILDPLGEDQ